MLFVSVDTLPRVIMTVLLTCLVHCAARLAAAIMMEGGRVAVNQVWRLVVIGIETRRV